MKNREYKPKNTEIMNQIVIAVRSYGRKSMADNLDKAYSTLANELEERDWAKLGLRDALKIIGMCLGQDAPEMARMAATRALDLIDDQFNRIGYTIPDKVNGDMTHTMHLMSQLSKEFGDSIKSLADAISDGCFHPKEIAECLSENRDLMKVCLQVEHYLREMADVYATTNR